MASRSFVKEGNDLIPLDQVIDDILNDQGIVSGAARDYYRRYYASDTEKIEMLLADRMSLICGITFVLGAVIGIVIAICIGG